MRKKIIIIICLLMAIGIALPRTSLNADSKAITDYTKNETVRVQSDANGNVDSISVEDQLKFDDAKGDTVKDVSSLTDIKNSEGDEEFTQDKKNNVIWDYKDENISYKGDSDLPLPVNVRITYYLDHQEIDPDELAGKSGRVTIRFDYENTLTKDVTVEGKNYNVHVPFLCLSAAVLDTDKFSNIKVTNGKVMDYQDSSIVAGIALPGLEDDLGLSNIEAAEDIDIPEYVEFSADVEDFELELTATVVTEMGIEDIDEVSDLDDLFDDFDEVQDATSQLADGSSKLAKAMGTMSGYLGQYFSGVSALNSGISTLNSSLKTITSEKESLDTTLDVMNDSLDTLEDSLDSADELSDEEKEELVQTYTTLLTSISNASKELNEIKQYVSSVDDVKDELNSLLNKLKDVNASVNSQIDDIIDQSENVEDDKKEALKDELDNVDAIDESTIASLEKAIEDLPDYDTSDIDTVLSYLDSIQEEQEDYESLLDILSDPEIMNSYVDTLKDNVEDAKELVNGVQALSGSIDAIYSGTKQLGKVAKTLDQSGTKLNSGFKQLVTGTKSLSKGMAKFDDAMSDFSTGDLSDVTNRFKALQEAEKQYDNYSGKLDGIDGSVVFIYESDEIKED